MNMTLLEKYYNEKIKTNTRRDFNLMTTWQIKYMTKSASFKYWKVIQAIKKVFGK